LDLLIKKFSAVAQGIGGSGRDSDTLQLHFTCQKISEGRDNCSGPYAVFAQAKKQLCQMLRSSSKSLEN